MKSVAGGRLSRWQSRGCCEANSVSAVVAELPRKLLQGLVQAGMEFHGAACMASAVALVVPAVLPAWPVQVRWWIQAGPVQLMRWRNCRAVQPSAAGASSLKEHVPW